MNIRDRLDDDDLPLTPEEQARVDALAGKEAEVERYFDQLMKEGWRWIEPLSKLGHPDDPEKYILIDPITFDLMYSAKLAHEVDARLRKQEDRLAR